MPTNTSSPAHPLMGIALPEPYFREPLPRSFRYASIETDTALAINLAQRVARCRGDLQAHVLRIYLHTEHGDTDQLTGALADLFITLGSKGRDLKLRMLDLASPHLDDAWLSFLYDHLDNGLDTITPLPATRYSRLTAAINGSVALVAKAAAVATRLSPLEEARDLLNNGAIDDARQFLEAVLPDNPDALDLHQELLEIYRHTRDSARLQQMEARLAPLAPTVCEAWQHIKETLLSDNVEKAVL